MASLPKALCIFGVLLAISLEFSNGIIVCNCGKAIRSFPLNHIRDFSINDRGDRCGTEIILTRNTTDGRQICLDPTKWQGQALRSCWTKTIKGDESRKAECLRPMRPRSGVESRTEATTDVTVTKELLFPSTSTSRFTSTTASSSSISSSSSS